MKITRFNSNNNYSSVATFSGMSGIWEILPKCQENC